MREETVEMGGGGGGDLFNGKKENKTVSHNTSTKTLFTHDQRICT